MNRDYKENILFSNHSKIDVLFVKNSDNFVVEEIPLYPCAGSGEFIILKIRKKDLSTKDLLKHISQTIGIKEVDIGYAGLKDKHAMTIQQISVHKKYADKLSLIENKQVKILSKDMHANKLKIGHLKGNKFFIRLKRVDKISKNKLVNILKKLNKEGFPNYFGFQRFGVKMNNHKDGYDILHGKINIRDRFVKKMCISAYQSHLFNSYLSKRMEISKIVDSFNEKDASKALNIDIEAVSEMKKQDNFLKILRGDLMHHYPFGKVFLSEDTKEDVDRFNVRDIVPTGGLYSDKMMKPEGLALEVEKDFFDSNIKEKGSRRMLWSFISDLDWVYKEDDNHFELNFSLQKGSYATVLIEELLGDRGVVYVK